MEYALQKYSWKQRERENSEILRLNSCRTQISNACLQSFDHILQTDATDNKKNNFYLLTNYL